MTKFFRALLVLTFAIASANAHAVLTIEITQGAQGALPIAVVPFGWEGAGTAPPVDVAAVVAADLHRSGRFSPLPLRDLLSRPQEASQVNFRDWRILGMDNLVIGRVRALPDGYEVRFQLFDVLRQSQLTGLTFRSDAAGLRRVAHQIADIIYETLLGEPGAFATRIAYITEVGEADGSRKYALEVADSDGHNRRPALVSRQPLMSPAWSPDGTRLAYVSFESGAPVIYIQDVMSGAREAVSRYNGLNGAPAWSPDGRKLALVLSKVRQCLRARSRQPQPAATTRNFAINTEPAWSPDGRHLLFHLRPRRQSRRSPEPPSAAMDRPSA